MLAPSIYRSVFLSYSHADTAAAERLKAELAGRGVEVWLDKAELAVGDRFARKIEEAIGRYGLLIVLISPNSVRSEWVRKEIAIARRKEEETGAVCIIPVFLGKTIDVEGISDRIGLALDPAGFPPSALWPLLDFLRHERLAAIGDGNYADFIEHFARTYGAIGLFCRNLAEHNLTEQMYFNLFEAGIDPRCLALFLEALFRKGLLGFGDDQPTRQREVPVLAARAVAVCVKIHGHGAEAFQRIMDDPRWESGDKRSVLGFLAESRERHSADTVMRLLIANRADWFFLRNFLYYNARHLEASLQDFTSYSVATGETPDDYKVEAVFYVLREHPHLKILKTQLSRWIELYFTERTFRSPHCSLEIFYLNYARAFESAVAPVVETWPLLRGQLKGSIESERPGERAVARRHLEALGEVSRRNRHSDRFDALLERVVKLLEEETEPPADTELDQDYRALCRAIGRPE